MSALVARFPSTWPLLRPRMRSFFDRLAPLWDKEFASGPERMAPLHAALEHLATAPARILDIGTGTGMVALELAGTYPDAEVVGVDLSERMIEEARRKTRPEGGDRVRFEVVDAADLPYEDGAFDLVTQMSVPAFYDETARVTAPGGHLVVISSLGAATPLHTPPDALRSGYERRGLTEVARGDAGRGTYFVARRRPTTGST
jgi:ubiquinone/menaquinone biosynthesis C-methylase UbiE